MRAQLIDSLPFILKQKYSIDARLESRNSFIDNRLTSVSGVRLGISYYRKLRLGAGISWLNTEVLKPVFPAVSDEGPRFKHLRFMYACYYADVVFYRTKRWQLSVPLQLGTGMAWYQQDNAYRLINPGKKHFLLLYEPGITAQFKVFKWFGAGADVAYRFAAVRQRTMGAQLNSPTYSFKILFWFDQLFFDLFPQSIITEKFGPSEW